MLLGKTTFSFSSHKAHYVFNFCKQFTDKDFEKVLHTFFLQPKTMSKICLSFQVAKMTLVEVDLTVNSEVSPPSSLGIRVVGVNMIHGVQDKLNIYIKKVVDDSLTGADGRIKINDHIVEVNGVSLVGVSQKFAAQTLSNCAISPETGTVHFVLARPEQDEMEQKEEDCNTKKMKCDENFRFYLDFSY